MLRTFGIVVLALALALTVGVLLVVLIAAVRTYRRFKRDDNRTLPEVKMYLDILLKRGQDLAYIIITDIPSDTFVQFAKYIRPEREIGLQLGFPRAPWSEPYYADFLSLLEARRIPFSIQPTGDETVSEFVHVDCQQDTDLALSLVDEIFHEIFDVPQDRRFRVRGEGISLKDELIDRYTPPPV